jgi:D-galactose 1-dehydrogenase
MTIRIGIIGYGKIARDQHVPAIAGDQRFTLAAVATRAGDPGISVPWFPTHEALLAGMAGGLDAVAICTPPEVRHAIASSALRAGLGVLLEKPPASSLGEIQDLQRQAHASGRTLYAAWHSQHAPAVPRAREALAGRSVTKLHISWREDVRKWHPGQEWIWEPGGFGVFDPGINALSIATRILPMPLLVRKATLLYPENRQAPIAASLAFAGGEMRAEMDWRHGDDEEWTIRVETVDGAMIELRDGGAKLLIGGAEQALEGLGEYPSIYDRFAALIGEGRVVVDLEPLRIVADAFLVGRRELAEPFV